MKQIKNLVVIVPVRRSSARACRLSVLPVKRSQKAVWLFRLFQYAIDLEDFFSIPGLYRIDQGKGAVCPPPLDDFDNVFFLNLCASGEHKLFEFGREHSQVRSYDPEEIGRSLL